MFKKTRLKIRFFQNNSKTKGIMSTKLISAFNFIKLFPSLLPSYVMPIYIVIIVILVLKLNRFYFSAAAFDKGDDRKLGKKPIFSSSKVNL